MFKVLIVTGDKYKAPLEEIYIKSSLLDYIVDYNIKA